MAIGKPGFRVRPGRVLLAIAVIAGVLALVWAASLASTAALGGDRAEATNAAALSEESTPAAGDALVAEVGHVLQNHLPLDACSSISLIENPSVIRVTFCGVENFPPTLDQIKTELAAITDLDIEFFHTTAVIAPAGLP